MLVTGAAQFGLSGDELTFLSTIFGALIVVVGPLYVSSFLQGRRTKKVTHEVTHNGGPASEQPTVKDLALGAFHEAAAAHVLADEARERASANSRSTANLAEQLADHITVSDQQYDAVLARLDRLDTQQEGT